MPRNLRGQDGRPSGWTARHCPGGFADASDGDGHRDPSLARSHPARLDSASDDVHVGLEAESLVQSLSGCAVRSVRPGHGIGRPRTSRTWDATAPAPTRRLLALAIPSKTLDGESGA